MLDVDIFPWIEEKRKPTKEERYRASTIVADRLCGAVSEPIVRNAQEKRQLALIEKYLTDRGYRLKAHPAATPLNQMEPGTFSFRMNVLVKPSGTKRNSQHPHRRGDSAKEGQAAASAYPDRSEIRGRFHEHEQAAKGRGHQDRSPQSDLRRRR